VLSCLGVVPFLAKAGTGRRFNIAARTAKGEEYGKCSSILPATLILRKGRRVLGSALRRNGNEKRKTRGIAMEWTGVGVEKVTKER
jgi:hypothetical protein